MIQFVAQNKEIVAVCVSVLGILVSLCFGWIRTWRHQICVEYQSQRSVALNILRDAFVQRTTAQYGEVARERRTKKTEVGEIYSRPEVQRQIRELAQNLEDRNRLERYFRRLEMASFVAFTSLWGSIVLCLAPAGALVVAVPTWVGWAWGILLGVGLGVFIMCVSAMCYLDQRFFRLVHRIIEPEE